MSQYDLADVLGLPSAAGQTMISNYEHGRIGLSRARSEGARKYREWLERHGKS